MRSCVVARTLSGVPEDREPVGVHLEALAKRSREARRAGRVLGPLDLLHHHLALPGQLGGVEGGKAHRVGQHVQALPGELGGHHRVVDGVVEGGPGVDLAAVGLDVAGDLPRAPAGGPLEEHVLVEVGQAGLVLPLVGPSHVHPDLERHHVGGPLWLVDQGEAVLESVTGGHVG